VTSPPVWQGTLDGNSCIEVQGPASDILIENNHVRHLTVGVSISDEILRAGDEVKDATGPAAGLLLHKNQFIDVQQPLVGTGLDNALVIP